MLTLPDNFRPMLPAVLSSEAEVRAVLAAKKRLFVFPKVDGIRAMVLPYKVLSRSLKVIPNRSVQANIQPHLHWTDNELVTGAPNAVDACRAATSAFMTHGGEPARTYITFDHIRPDLLAQSWYQRTEHVFDVLMPHAEVTSFDALMDMESMWVRDLGYEGLILRDPEAPYKFGRSTLREGWLMKWKRFTDFEARIVGMVEMMHNDNELEANELGLAKRSKHKENLRPAGVMGALECKRLEDADDPEAPTFEIGTGFTADERAEFWKNRDWHIGRTIVKGKFFDHGVKEKPRHTTYLSIRAPEDMG